MNLGHHGNPCPINNNVPQEIRQDDFVEGMGIGVEDIQEDKDTGQEHRQGDILMEHVVIVVHTTGVFQHHVR